MLKNGGHKIETCGAPVLQIRFKILINNITCIDNGYLNSL